jgi:hypothetical protein
VSAITLLTPDYVFPNLYSEDKGVVLAPAEVSSTLGGGPFEDPK